MVERRYPLLALVSRCADRSYLPAGPRGGVDCDISDACINITSAAAQRDTQQAAFHSVE